MIGEADDRIFDLHHQFARGCQDQRTRVALARRVAERRHFAHQPLHNRQRKRQRLTSAGFRTSDDIAAFDSMWNHGALHRTRALEAEIVQTLASIADAAAATGTESAPRRGRSAPTECQVRSDSFRRRLGRR